MNTKFLILALVLAVTACGRGYSEGERTGVVTKLSYKGLLFKSWEGEMVMGGVRSDGSGNMGSNVWAFNVSDTALVKPISEAQNAAKPITIKYVQWMVSPPSIESDYEAVAVAPVGGEKDPRP